MFTLLNCIIAYIQSAIISPSAFNFDGWLLGCLSPGRKKQSSARPFSAEQTSKSAPNVERCALEQDIGMELRAISDCFHLECAGFVSRLCKLFLVTVPSTILL